MHPIYWALGVVVALLALVALYYLYHRYAASPPYVLLPTITSKLCEDDGKDGPHYLAYITAEEHELLVRENGLGLRRARTQGVPCYPKRKMLLPGAKRLYKLSLIHI